MKVQHLFVETSPIKKIISSSLIEQNIKAAIAAHKLLFSLYIIEDGGRGFTVSDNDYVSEILMGIRKYPDKELSGLDATLLCRGIAEHLDDDDKEVVDATYGLLARFLPQASKEVNDALIPMMVLHDL